MKIYKKMVLGSLISLISFPIIACSSSSKKGDSGVIDIKSESIIKNELKRINPIFLINNNVKENMLLLPYIEKENSKKLIINDDFNFPKRKIDLLKNKNLNEVFNNLNNENKELKKIYDKIQDKNNLLIVYELKNENTYIEYQLVKAKSSSMINNFIKELKDQVFNVDEKKFEKVKEINKKYNDLTEKRIISFRERIEPEIGLYSPFKAGILNYGDWDRQYRKYTSKINYIFEKIYNKYNKNFIEEARNKNGSNNEIKVRFKYNIFVEPIFDRKKMEANMLFTVFENGNIFYDNNDKSSKNVDIKDFTNINSFVVKYHKYDLNGSDVATNSKINENDLKTSTPNQIMKEIIERLHFLFSSYNNNGNFGGFIAILNIIKSISTSYYQQYKNLIDFVFALNEENRLYKTLKEDINGFKINGKYVKNKEGINYKIKEFNDGKDEDEQIPLVKVPTPNNLSKILNNENTINEFIKNIVENPNVDFNKMTQKILNMKIKINDKFNDKQFGLDRLTKGFDYAVSNFVFIDIFLETFVKKFSKKLSELYIKEITSVRSKIKEIELKIS